MDEQIHEELSVVIDRLRDMRAIKSGKKTYDYMLAGYFEDMLQVLAGAREVLKPGGHFVLVLGDSAPYGVHIPTERIVGRLGNVAVGFASYDIEQTVQHAVESGVHNPQASQSSSAREHPDDSQVNGRESIGSQGDKCIGTRGR